MHVSKLMQNFPQSGYGMHKIKYGLEGKKRISRIIYIHPRSCKLYYLRMFLNMVKGPRDYEEIMILKNIVYSTFQSVCNSLGLLEDDKKWHEALNEAS